MTTSNNPQSPRPGPVAQQLTKLQSNGHQAPSNGQKLSIGKPPKKTTSWTGFSGRTLWDWIQFFAVLAIPVLVAAGTLYFTQQITLQQTQAGERQHQTDIQIAQDQQKETILHDYISDMQNLLLNYNLHNSKPKDEVRQIATTRTLTTLKMLDQNRKTTLLLFLYGADLINVANPIIDLDTADLSGIDLRAANLRGANLMGVNLNGALLNDADLTGANLSYTQMIGANLDHDHSKPLDYGFSLAPINNTDLTDANLTDANLSNIHAFDVIFTGATLYSTNMTNADLKESGFNDADLTGTEFGDANMNSVELSEARLRFTLFWETNLSNADLRGDDLSNSFLYKINLRGADLNGATGTTIKQLEQKSSSLKGATMPDGSIHP